MSNLTIDEFQKMLDPKTAIAHHQEQQEKLKANDGNIDDQMDGQANKEEEVKETVVHTQGHVESMTADDLLRKVQEKKRRLLIERYSTATTTGNQ